MIRALCILNLCLLSLLGALCIHQWTREHADTNRIAVLQAETALQQTKLANQAEAIRHQEDAIAGFKTQAAKLENSAELLQASLSTNAVLAAQLDAERAHSTNQAGEWIAAIAQYKSAVSNRDETIKTLLDQRDSLARSQREAGNRASEAVSAYNQLAEKYKDAVERYNKLVDSASTRKTPASPP